MPNKDGIIVIESKLTLREEKMIESIQDMTYMDTRDLLSLFLKKYAQETIESVESQSRYVSFTDELVEEVLGNLDVFEQVEKIKVRVQELIKELI